jgi:hypothetical protein
MPAILLFLALLSLGVAFNLAMRKAAEKRPLPPGTKVTRESLWRD